MTKFRLGTSGNPRGRPLGRPDRRLEFRDLLASRASEVIQTVINAAVSGDMTACKLLLDKIVPNIRYSDVPFRLRAEEGSLGERGGHARARGKLRYGVPPTPGV